MNDKNPEERVCATCKYLKQLPFSEDYVCTNDNSEYADCPSDYPENDTCEEWENKND